jgi:hypothetical protein
MELLESLTLLLLYLVSFDEIYEYDENGSSVKGVSSGSSQLPVTIDRYSTYHRDRFL